MRYAAGILAANRPRLMREVIMAALTGRPNIEIVGEVADERDILEQCERLYQISWLSRWMKLKNCPAICDRVLREHPQLRVIAVASRKDRTLYYWASFDIIRARYAGRRTKHSRICGEAGLPRCANIGPRVAMIFRKSSARSLRLQFYSSDEQPLVIRSDTVCHEHIVRQDDRSPARFGHRPVASGTPSPGSTRKPRQKDRANRPSVGAAKAPRKISVVGWSCRYPHRSGIKPQTLRAAAI
jgi:chemotaxis response regulator CheB